jgi:DNA-binding NtrC family response regulator
MNSDSPSPTSKSSTKGELSKDRPLVVLVVDDLEGAREHLRRLLGLAGFAVLTTATIDAALQLLDQWSVDAVVADLWLGGAGAADGGNLLDACKRWHPGVVRILATADPLGATLARVGGHLYYDKDLGVSELVLMIRMWAPRG